MHFFVSFVVLLSLLVSSLGISSPSLAAECSFVLGFKTLHDLAPEVVGDCVADQRYNPENGDSLQETARGLLVWRKADNFTAFTDGYRSWVNGPFGVQPRLNTERFQWEAVQQLRNAEYVLPLVDPQDFEVKETPVRFEDGQYALSSDSPPVRVMAGLINELVATGDLNGDGTPDAVAPLYLNTGGTGTFIFLAAMIDRGGTLVHAGRAFLGDRVSLKSITIAPDATITLDMIAHGPDDPLCCPTQRTVETFPASGLLTGANEVGSGAITLEMRSWKWIKTSYKNGTEVVPGAADAFTLTFEKGRVSATTDCNSMTGTYEVAGNELTFGKNFVATMKFCSGSQEDVFSSMLQEVRAFSFTSRGELVFVLKDESGSSVFR